VLNARLDVEQVTYKSQHTTEIAQSQQKK